LLPNKKISDRSVLSIQNSEARQLGDFLQENAPDQLALGSTGEAGTGIEDVAAGLPILYLSGFAKLAVLL
jgi:hypothetical protein